MLNKWRRSILIGLIAIGVLMALYLAWERHKAEQANKQVELVLDWNQVKEAALRENITEEALLERYTGDITGVLFKEPSLNDLMVNGQVLLKTGTELLWDLQTGTVNGPLPEENDRTLEIEADRKYLIFSDADEMRRVSHNIKLKLGQKGDRVFDYYIKTSQGVVPVLGTNLPLKDFMDLGVGFNDQDFSRVRSLGLNIVPQIRFWRDVTEKDLDFVFGQFQDMPVSAVFFNDSDLPGIGLPAQRQNEALHNLAKHMEILGVPAGMVEFFPQKGIATLGNFMEKNLVRMHSIPEREMATMTQSRAIDRYTLAVTDRDIRVLLVRLFPNMGLEDSGVYLAELRSSLEAEGFQPGQAGSFGTLPFSRIYLIIMGLGVASGGTLLMDILGFRRLGFIFGVLGFFGFLGLLILGQTGIARKGMALVSVIIFPVLSVVSFLGDRPAGIGKAVRLLFKMSLISLVGALLMVGMLADKSFMYTLDQFMGVKLAHLVPVLLLMGIFWLIKSPEGNNPYRKILNVLDCPVTVKYAGLLGVLAVILLIYIMRTGNESMAVSAWELTLRARLDDLLAVRPRTKEFLIGHPLMLLLLFLGYRDKYLPILAVAVIGQVSLVNTFAHIHTPLAISLVRTFNGLWLGIIVGLVLIGAVFLGKRVMENLHGQ